MLKPAGPSQAKNDLATSVARQYGVDRQVAVLMISVWIYLTKQTFADKLPPLVILHLAFRDHFHSPWLLLTKPEISAFNANGIIYSSFA
jgi:hypothetical protein